MGITFNADEIFEMAEEIERNGAKFYREAAENASDEKMKRMLLDMAVMEDGHLHTFEEMRKELGLREKEAMIFDRDNEAALYLQTMADGRGYEGKVSLAEKLTGKETPEEILRIAVDAEKSSVVFYVGLKDLVSARAGKDKVEGIIREEMGHIATLKKELAALK
ncbi:MAG: ferritin family protein [Planctomycetota bacterium]|nr:MAG: ferritin family protein [Planctomycetota bacterium]